MIKISRSILPMTAIVLLTLSACNKRNQPDVISPPQDTMMVRQLTAGGQDFISYTYTSDRFVETYVSQWQNNSGGDLSRIETQYHYSDGRLTGWTNAAGYANFNVSAGKAISADIFRQDDKLLARHFFHYDDSGRLAEALEVISDNLVDQVTQTRVRYTYGVDGNLNKVEYAQQYKGSADFQISYVETYEVYDGKINPEPTAVMGHFLPGIRLYKNNPRQIRITRPGSADVEVWRIQYTYTSQGYPANRIKQLELNGVLKPAIQFSYSY